MRLAVYFTLMEILLFLPGSAQTFQIVNDPANAITLPVNWTSSQSYVGAAWIDFDGDHDLDLAMGRNELYRNDGGGIFTKIITGSFGSSALSQGESGMTWADYDNDGDLDVYLVGLRSDLYQNNQGQFTRVSSGTIGQGSIYNAWAASWGDYDNDGFVDLVLAAPFAFNNITTSNLLFHNNGDGSFSRIDTGAVVSQHAPFTVPSWFDYDQDGDIDLFIASGPANGTIAQDYFYRNLLTETGSAVFEPMTDNFAVESRDGQNINWIDYDNDGDLDMYATNYVGNTGGFRNSFYRNDGGSFSRITTGAIATDADVSLGNIWEDFDNDGYIDCFITNQAGRPNRFYHNNGDGTFTRLNNTGLSDDVNIHVGSSAGDYDLDGDLDLFVWSTPGASRRLFRNELNNGNHWADFELVGTVSNRASIGATIRIKAVIGGTSVWQTRILSAQNSFMGQTGLFPHFGLGSTTTIDSVVVTWPSGTVKILTAIPADQFIVLTESTDSTASPIFRPVSPTSTFALNPFTKQLRAGAVPPAIYNILEGPDGILLDSISGSIQWNPTTSDVGANSVVIVASNSTGTDTLEVSIEVLPFEAPSVQLKTEKQLFIGSMYKDTIYVTGSPAPIFSLLSAPSGMSIGSTTGIISWTPTHEGEYPVTVVATNAAAADTIAYNVIVFPTPTLAVLQNPALPKYADLVLNCAIPLQTNPTVKLGNVIVGSMQPISGNDRIYQFPLKFEQSAGFVFDISATSQTGYGILVSKSFNALLAKPGETGTWTSDRGLISMRVGPHVFSRDMVLLIEETAVSEGLTRIEITSVGAIENPIELTLQSNMRLFEDGNASPLPAVRRGNTVVSKITRFGRYNVQFGESVNSLDSRSADLLPNYPNPFNPVTTIQYSIVTSGIIDLAVYNLLGQRVRTLFQGPQESGIHRMTWDSRNDAGRIVSTGIYLLRLESPSGSHTRKIMFIK